MYPILFQLGPITIYSFGALMALAALSAAWVVHSELKRRGYDPELASAMIFAAAVGGLLGAGGAAAVSWIAKKNHIPWRVGADIAAPALALAYGVGRLGCHVAGDGDWGSITDMPWGVAYTNAIIGWVDPMTGVPYPPGVRVHPTPIYEFLQSVAIFGILWGIRTKGLPSGTIAWLYLVLAGLARFTVEFWRVNPVLAAGLSEAQWISLMLMAVGSLMLVWRRVRVAC
jgi:phosphatidylglycerol---prolipoprotein diacylglyceryl transferase